MIAGQIATNIYVKHMEIRANSRDGKQISRAGSSAQSKQTLGNEELV